MSPIATQRQIDKAANDDLIRKARLMEQGKPATESEIRSAAAMQGQRTAAANRLQAHGQTIDWDNYQPDSEIRSAWDDLPDDSPLPDAL
jgi:hypothetical protein